MALFDRPAAADTTRLKAICSECGAPYERDSERSQCETCKPKDDGSLRPFRKNRHELGYDNTWARLSIRARKLQPFCSDCGATDDLTADHSETAWARREAGKVIRLKDIDVVCRRCNSERGAARGEKATGLHRPGPYAGADF